MRAVAADAILNCDDATERSSTIAVVGATGRQGGAVARRLLEDGWNVRALTRSLRLTLLAKLAAAGAEVVRADMAERAFRWTPHCGRRFSCKATA